MLVVCCVVYAASAVAMVVAVGVWMGQCSQGQNIARLRARRLALLDNEPCSLPQL